VELVDEVAPQIPALAFSLASWPSAGPEGGVPVFLIPALADDQRLPKASPPLGFAAAGLAPGVDAEVDCEAGAWTEVK
jgi:hypothetical protein